MIYIGFSIFVTAFIYFNVLGLFKNVTKVAESRYKRTLWKYKKIEIAEKAVICALFAVIIMTMKYDESQIATVALILGAVMMLIEYFFGRYMRKAFVCPNCGGPIWEGNFIVILQPWRICPHCNYHLDGAEPKHTENEEEETDE